jgi:hypothetical protein
MNHYFTSSGERVSQGTIDRNIRKAKELKLKQFLEAHGYYFCEECQSNNCKPIDCSHDISVKECKESGRTELAWDVNNITLRGRECHQKLDKNGVQWK